MSNSSVPVKGADISYIQSGFDFAAAKDDGLRFVIIRAGIGKATDSALYNHIKGAKAVGMPFGFYWYSLALSIEDAAAEADACLKAIQGEKPAYPVFFDMETKQQINNLNSKQRTDIARTFCDRVMRGGYLCGVYSNPSWLENYYITPDIVGVYDIWLAAWTDNPNNAPAYSYGQTMWQWGTDFLNGMEYDGNLCYVDYPKITAEFYDSHQKPEDKLYVGQSVRVKKGALSYYGGKLADFVYDNIYTVMQVGTASLPDYIVIGQDGDVTAAVHAADLIPANDESVKFAVGDNVRVKQGAPDYGGKPLAPFVYNQVYTVMQVGKTGVPDYIVIGQGNSVTAAVNADNLILDSTAGISVGDTVKVKYGATTYSGKPLAAFVYTERYTVMQIGKDGAPDYAVIGQGGEVTAAVNVSSLVKI